MRAIIRLLVLQRPSRPLEEVLERLRDWGCALHISTRAEDLLGAVAAFETDIILVDAGVEGSMAAIGQIKADPATHLVPVLAAAVDDPGMVAAHALALGADDVLVLPVEDTELSARVHALARIALMEDERRRREAVLRQFQVHPMPEAPGVPALDRVGILLIGPASAEQVQVTTALGGSATIAYAETVERSIDRLRRHDLDVAIVTGIRDHDHLRRLCESIRADTELFDLPVMLIGAADAFPERAQPFGWGASDVLFQPFHPEILRLRVQSWVRQQRLRRRLRGTFDGAGLPPTADRLTRLHGHGFLHAYVEHLIEDVRHDDDAIGVVGFTVANIDEINRRAGFACGDRVLAATGATIARLSRAEDLPARVSGRRFCLVLGDGTADVCETAVRRIQRALTDAPLDLGDQTAAEVAIESGLATLSAGDTAADLIGRAFAGRGAGTVAGSAARDAAA